MSTIPVTDLKQVVNRVFVLRESTLESEASGASVEDLKDTVIATRGLLSSAASALPDTAYAAQPDDSDGNEVWSAGEVISHIAGTMIWTDANLRKIQGLDEVEPPASLLPFTEVKVRSKAESGDALAAADAELQRILESIPEDVDPAQTFDHDTFGTIGIKGWLLLTALHEGDHTNQLRDLDR